MGITAAMGVCAFYDVCAAKETALSLLRAPPDAVLCGNDVIAQGVLYACQALDIPVPQGVSIVGVGGLANSIAIEPALTTVSLPAHRIGIEAADMAAAMISGKAIRSRAIAHQLTVRRSSAPPRHSARSLNPLT